MKGLDVTVLKLSAVREENEKLRYDAEFFGKDAHAAYRALRHHRRFGDLVAEGYRVIYESTEIIPREIGIEEGLPFFLQAADIETPFVQPEGMGCVSRADWERYPKGRIKAGEVLIEVKGLAEKVALVTDDVPRNTLVTGTCYKMRPHDPLDAPLLLSFLTSRYGQALKNRLKSNLLVAFVSKEDLFGMPVPQFGVALKKAIARTIEESFAAQKDAREKMTEAEALLTKALGLSGWQPPEPLTYTRRASEAFAAGRLDAQYFAPRVRELLTLLGAGGRTVRDAAPPRQEKFDPKAPRPPRAPTAQPMPAQGNALGSAPTKASALKGRPNAAMSRPVGADSVSVPDPRALPWAGMGQAVGLTDAEVAGHGGGDRAAGLAAETFRYIEISDVQGDGTATDNTIPLSEAPSRATWHVQAGDVLTSTVRPNRRLSAIATPEQDGCIASSGFAVLQPQAVPAEVLLTYLRLPLFCELMDLHTSASLYPAISERDLLALPFPEIPAKASAAIVAAVRAAHTARARARTLLAQAQRAVEIAIEQNEAAALDFLTSGTP